MDKKITVDRKTAEQIIDDLEFVLGVLTTVLFEWEWRKVSDRPVMNKMYRAAQQAFLKTTRARNAIRRGLHEI